ncbi:MAG: hypothetical protein ABH828_05390 [archaeon]
MSQFKLFIKGIQKGIEYFGHNISLIVSSVLLFIVYIVGIGITSIFAKIVSKHFLELKTSKKKKSYWVNLDLKKGEKDDYYRLF